MTMSITGARDSQMQPTPQTHGSSHAISHSQMDQGMPRTRPPFRRTMSSTSTMEKSGNQSPGRRVHEVLARSLRLNYPDLSEIIDGCPSVSIFVCACVLRVLIAILIWPGWQRDVHLCVCVCVCVCVRVRGLLVRGLRLNYPVNEPRYIYICIHMLTHTYSRVQDMLTVTPWGAMDNEGNIIHPDDVSAVCIYVCVCIFWWMIIRSRYALI